MIIDIKYYRTPNQYRLKYLKNDILTNEYFDTYEDLMNFLNNLIICLQGDY